MTNEERLKKLEQLKELRALKVQQQAQKESLPTGEFFDPNRYALENIPSMEEMKDPNNPKTQNFMDIMLGMGGAGPSLAGAPIARGMKTQGKNIYKKAFKVLDFVLKKDNKKPISDVLFKHKITGTGASIYEKGERLVDKLIKEQRQILEKIDKKVPEADLDRALQPLRDTIDEFKSSRDPVKRQAADVLEQDLKAYQDIKFEGGAPGVRGFEEGYAMPISPSQLSAIKSSAQKLVPKTAYSQEIGRMNPVYQQGRKVLGQGLKEEVERAAAQASPELQQQLLGVNTDLSSLLSAGEALQQQAKTGLNKNAITSVDALVATFGGQPIEVAAKTLAAKKAADLSKTAWLRTNVGKGMYNLGDYGGRVVDPATAYSLWYLMNTNSQEER